jgi:ATP-binding cassette subfamily B protein
MTPIATALAASSELPNRLLLKWMFRFARPVLGLALIACFYLTAWVVVEVLSSRQAGVTVNFIKTLHASSAAAQEGFVRWITSADADAVHLRHLIFVLASFVTLYALLRYLREVANTKMSMEMVFYIREAIYDKLQHVGFGFHDAISSGQLINRALSDLQNVRAFVQTAILTTLEIVEVVLFYIALIYTRNHWLAALALVPLPIWTWYVLRFSKKVQPVAKSVMEAEDKNVSIITENIAGVHVIKAFATERQEIGKYGANCDTFKERVLTRIRLFADFNPVIRSIAQMSYLSLFLVAGILTIKGRLGPGDFLILGGAMSAILARLQAVATINEQYQNAIVSARRLYEVLMAPPTVPERPGAKPLPAGTGEVAFEHVSFGYAADKTVLRDVNFRVKGGSVVAIVGPTGAGKTTLVNLLSRFYDPPRGAIRIDGVDLRDVSLASLRTQVAFVFQETYLFSDTVAANIAYGRPNITRGEIEAAARLAQAHEFIDQMPKGYEAVLSEKGSSLSGGQRQRLAIARAILTNPRVLILDDATAAIDPETEDLIRRGMRFVMRGRTTFIIAHRISTVKAADLVIVLEHGRIAQMGTHDQLMREDGHYREIAAAQLSTDDEDVVQAADRAAQPAPPPVTTPKAEAKTDAQPSHMDRMHDEKHVSEAVQDADRSAAAAAPMAK